MGHQTGSLACNDGCNLYLFAFFDSTSGKGAFVDCGGRFRGVGAMEEILTWRCVAGAAKNIALLLDCSRHFGHSFVYIVVSLSLP